MENPPSNSQALLDPLDQSLFAERYALGPIMAEDEKETIQLIQLSLMSYPDEGMVLASTRRRLPSFYTSYQDEGSCYLVLRDRMLGHIAGGVGIRSFAGLDPREHLGELRELVITHDYRGLGLGRRILEAGIERAKQLRYERLYLEATSEMRHAQSLFRRCGFRPVEFRRKEKELGANEIFPSYFVLESIS